VAGEIDGGGKRFRFPRCPASQSSKHPRMNYFFEPLRSAWIGIAVTRLARSGPVGGAFGHELNALQQRRRLRFQQQRLQAGASGYEVLPPYPSRPRPPS
jgi:hypothetical protein